MFYLERGFNPKDIPFTIKAREACTACKRYGYSAKCPPNLKSVRYYKNLTHSYKYAILIIYKYDINTDDYKTLGKVSSLELMRDLVQRRDSLLGKQKFPIAFSAGSCKLCDKCNIDKCIYPSKSLIPLEGMGVDVVALVKKVANIDIKFPVQDNGYFFRIGVLLYDDL